MTLKHKTCQYLAPFIQRSFRMTLKNVSLSGSKQAVKKYLYKYGKGLAQLTYQNAKRASDVKESSYFLVRNLLAIRSLFFRCSLN